MSRKKASDVIDFNPKRPIKKGSIAPFVDMAALPTDSRDINSISEKEFKGGGAKFKNGDTIFARITPCLENGKTAKVSGLPHDVCAHGSTEFVVMSAKAPFYDEDFVYYLARLPEFREYAQSRMEGTSGRQRVPWQALAEFEYQFPDKDIRKKVGSILKSFDDKIENNRKINETLEAMAQACFKSWFVDFEPTRAKIAVLEKGGSEEEANLAAMGAISGKTPSELEQLRSQSPEAYKELNTTATLFPPRLVESDLGQIPQGWEVRQAEDIYSISIGKTPPRKESQWFSSNNKDVKWLSIRDMGNSNTFALNSSEYLTSEAIEKYNVKVLPAGTVFLSFKLTIGRVSIASEKMCTNEAIAHFRISDKTPSSCWTYCYLKQFNYESLGSTSSIANAVNSKTIKSMPILNIPKEIIDCFNKNATDFFKQIEILEKQSQTLTQTRDALLPKLLSGEIDVGGIEHKIEEEAI